MTAQKVAIWLESLSEPGKAIFSNVRPVQITIGKQTWEGAFYTQTGYYTAEMDAVKRRDRQVGDSYSQDRIYLLGKLPKSYNPKRGENHLAFTWGGNDWYISGYLPKPIDDERMKQHHPFGIYFMLGMWDLKEPIDKYARKPYTRLEMILKVL